MGVMDYLSQPFAQHALIAGTLVAITCGLIGPFVIIRNMAFAVHGTSELAFTGAAAGLLIMNNAIAGALVGAVVISGGIGFLSVKERERDSSIGVILAFGLAVGVLLLSLDHSSESAVTDILFGDIFHVSSGQIAILVGIGIVASIIMAIINRPLLFASIDPDVASARGLSVRLLALVFLVVLAFTVTAASQIVGTLLVLSLAMTPAAAAQRFTSNPLLLTLFSVIFAVVATAGGLVTSLAFRSIDPSVFVASLSFFIYVIARIIGPIIRNRRDVHPDKYTHL